ncbi:unnamed protein product [Brassica rapa]|uniref:Uncharacterized protein n=2 Tax=Brassica TaxID=3705 RepID=A0A8D9HE60_BRACM|nr:unnamed protein product [Brassica napus]CAG7897840.1 unnamed protein product [Brassica rapa]
MQTDVLFYILLLHKKRQHTDALSFKPTRQKRDFHSVKNLYLNLKLNPLG